MRMISFAGWMFPRFDMLEQLGAKYYSNGKQQDALKILKDNGANYVRLKLWVDPYDESDSEFKL